jgi:hypothetical protein
MQDIIDLPIFDDTTDMSRDDLAISLLSRHAFSLSCHWTVISRQ